MFASLGGGGAEWQVRRLARTLDPARYRLDAVVCRHLPGLPDQALARMSATGVQVDTQPYGLSLEDTVAYLAGILPGYDCVVACEPTADLAPALEQLHLRPVSIDLQTLLADEPTTVLDAARRLPAAVPALFGSFFQGGFECSTHRRGHDRARIDVIAATRHDALAASDYAALQAHGLVTVRDGLRWHLIERSPGVYDWSSLEHQLAGVAATGTEVIWDLLHYGWPDDVDVWRPDFVARFAAFAEAAARTIAARLPGRHLYAPVNEISFLSWGGGDAGYMNPFATARGFELKVQLVRAAIAAMEAIRRVDPDARFVHADPVIHIATDPARPDDAAAAEGHRQAQFQAWDMIAGRCWPQLGGRADLLDIVGVNFYHNNQWVHGGAPIARGHPLYRAFHHMLAETYARYGRPIFVAETGIEGEARPEWLAHICDEVALAIDLGVPVAGICLYPILDHPGWDDDRDCPNGLLRTPPEGGTRLPFMPLARELAYQRTRFS
ncbi:hypothetical protein [Sphingomonas sp. Leaf357]|uniref:hypothetical protein n=1 Tax=Sphingomonas sp. Leaf357 TaxID=1736350 RepID=UPI0012E158B4|nr:hypothetical protein [Sphingomonas sp. Leaf357]